MIRAEAGTQPVGTGTDQVGRRAAGLVLQVLDAGEQGLTLHRSERAVPRQEQQERQEDHITWGIDRALGLHENG